MGLDITAYRGLEKVREVGDDDEPGDIAYDSGWVLPYENPDFPGRLEGLEKGLYYKAAETFEFRAGSYSGYNLWREHLATMVGIKLPDFWGGYDASKPFAELIHFTDCDGTIGPVASARIAADFDKHAGRAIEFADEVQRRTGEGEWFLEKYRAWHKAFKLAADHGCVRFW